MRIVDSGPHTVSVEPRNRIEGDIGTDWDYGIAVAVPHVRVSPQSPEMIDTVNGYLPVTTVRIVGAGTWPGGPGARITVTDGPYEGRTLTQVGDTVVRASNPRVAHYVVTARTQE